jgi:hypothetical protein
MIPGCNSTTSTSISGTDAIYSFLESDSIVLVKNSNGGYKSIPSAFPNMFTVQQGGVNVFLDPSIITYVSENPLLSFEFFSDPSGSLRIYFDNVPAGIISTYVDFSYAYGGEMFTNRWTIDAVQDGSESSTLVYSSPTLIAKQADHNYTTVVNDIERVIKEVFTSGMFRYKGDVVKISFYATSDITSRLGNYFAVRIGANNVFNLIFKFDIPQNSDSIGKYDIVLTAVNGSYDTQFLSNQQIQLNVANYATSTTASGASYLSDIYTNEPVDLLVSNTNMGTVQFIYNYVETLGNGRFIKMWNFTIEKFPNKNIL